MNQLGCEQGGRRTLTDRLTLACSLRGIKLSRPGKRSIKMVSPEGIEVTKGTIKEIWDEYHSDPAFRDLPVLNS